MTLRIFLYLTLICFIPSSFTYADDDNEPFKGTTVNLSISEKQEVDEDLLIAHMQFEFEAKTAREVQEVINKKMTKALYIAKNLSEVKISTEQYNVYKYYPHPRKKDGSKNDFVWRGSQSIMTKSKDSQKLLQLSADLQKMGFAMNSLRYTISPEKYESVKDSMIESAIEKLKTKAKRITKSLNKDEYDFININVDNNPYRPVMMQRSYSANADFMSKENMAPPVAAPGSGVINLNIHAIVRIKD